MRDNTADRVNVIDTLNMGGYILHVYGSKSEPLFLGSEVASLLQYNVNRSTGRVDTSGMIRILDDSEKVKKIATKEDGKTTQAWMLTEFGLYEIMLLSKKPMAKIFKKYVKNVIKSVRLTGGYIPVYEDESPQELMRRAYELAERTLQHKNTLINDKSDQIQFNLE